MTTVDNMMHRLLTDAGLAAGMAVLDVGSGHGNLAAMLAPIVGPTGSILGIDHDVAVLPIARKKMHELGYVHVNFSEADLTQPLPENIGAFDAVVGRRVLMYLPDPAATLRALAALLKPGGLLIFQEIDASLRQPNSAMPLHEKMFDWTWRTVVSEGADPAIGLKLGAMVSAAGVAVEDVRAEVNIQTPDQDYPTETIVRMMVDRMAKAGVASRAEILAEADGLDARLLQERRSGWKTFAGETLFGIWGRKITG